MSFKIFSSSSRISWNGGKYYNCCASLTVWTSYGCFSIWRPRGSSTSASLTPVSFAHEYPAWCWLIILVWFCETTSSPRHIPSAKAFSKSSLASPTSASISCICNPFTSLIRRVSRRIFNSGKSVATRRHRYRFICAGRWRKTFAEARYLTRFSLILFTSEVWLGNFISTFLPTFRLFVPHFYALTQIPVLNVSYRRF